ncbi:MAG: DUF4238 domain-containing protein [Calditrichaeota bacterium]|nr:MAG: DUF4238 domain-containing protein [Calditrichota bacterium]
MNTVKKNQHYIPKFYLRNFSYELNAKQIGIYNIKSSFFFQTAKLKTQGSKDFFYGHDGVIENNLANIENLLASEVREIIRTENVIQKDGIKYLNLLIFVGLTHVRNPVYIDFIKKTREKFIEKLDGHYGKINLNNAFPEITHEEVIKIALSHCKDVVGNLFDLKYKLLINRTKIPFITSDFPIVRQNQFLEKRKISHGKTGYGNIGLQIFIPLNPKITLVFYDSNIYKIGSRKITLDLTRKADIEKLNILQILNCGEALFFNENISKSYIEYLISKSQGPMNTHKPLVKLHPNVKLIGIDEEKGPSQKSSLLELKMVDSDVKLEIKGLKILPKAKKIKINKELIPLRKWPKKLRANSR